MPNPPPVAVDFETYYASDYSLAGPKGLPTFQYVNDPRFDAYLVAIHSADIHYVGHPKDFNWHLLAGRELLAHNALFDECVYMRLQELGVIPKIEIQGWTCTADLVAYQRCMRSLDKGAEYLLGIKVDKGPRGQMKGKHWSDVQGTEFEQTFLKYADVDATICHQFAEKLSWPESEKRLSRIGREAGIQGMRVDIKRMESGLEKMANDLFEIGRSIPWDWNDGAHKTPLSPTFIRAECRKVGIPCPTSFDMKDEDCDRWMEKWSEKYPWVRAIRDWRRENTLYQKLQMLQRGIKPGTDRFQFGLKFYGGHCLPGDAEVLTRTGWVRLDQWRGGTIAQYTADRAQVSWQHAEPNYFLVPEGEQALAVDSAYLKGTFTLGHTMPYLTHGSFQFKTCKAGDFASGSRYVPVGGNLISDGALSVDQMRLLVAVQADGHWLPAKDGGGLQFLMKKPRKLIRLRELFARLSITYREKLYQYNKNRGHVTFNVSRKDCPYWLTPDRKVFGPWVFGFSSEAIQQFPHELLLWDGYQKTREYSSTIQENVEWACTLVHLAGKSATVSVRNGKRPGHSPLHRLVWRNRAHAMVFREQCNRVEAPRIVYCPTTETGFFMVRQQGKIYVTGNTGRWSGSERFNMQNLPWRTVVPGIDLRGMFLPDNDDEVLLIVDYSSIEPRVLAWLVGDYEMLDLLRAGHNVYHAHAVKTMGWDNSQPLKQAKSPEAKRLYAMAKMRVLLLGYGGGWEKFMSAAKQQYGVEIPADEARATVASYRESSPLITQFWRKRQQGLAISAAQHDPTYSVMLPSGRAMTYFRPYAAKGKWKDGSERVDYLASYTLGEKPERVYGGLITENVTQALSRDIMADGWLKLVDDGFKTKFTSHDEIIISVPRKDAAEAQKHVEDRLAQAPAWIADLPLGSESAIRDRYCKI